MSIIISFSGVDGTGKTTIATLLKIALEKEGKQAVLLHHTGAAPKRMRTKKYNPLSYFLVLCKDYLQLITSILKSHPHDILICDRYLYETLAKLHLRSSRSYPLLDRFFLLITPCPSLAFLLTASANTSFKRDQEFPLDYHQKKREVYNNLFARLEITHQTLNTDQLTKAQILTRVLENLKLVNLI